MAAKTKAPKNVTLAEEKAAAKAEQKRESKPISPARLKDVQRVHELKELMAPFQAEIDEIKVRVFKEMDNKGVDVLTRKGVEIVSRDRVEGEEWDKKSIKDKFPEVVVQFVIEKISYRVNWKNPFHQ
jgi:hypothetical protein